MKKLAPIRFMLDGKNYEVKLTAAGFLTYVHYTCTRADGVHIAGGGIARCNYRTNREHRDAIRRECVRAVGEVVADNGARQ